MNAVSLISSHSTKKSEVQADETYMNAFMMDRQHGCMVASLCSGSAAPPRPIEAK